MKAKPKAEKFEHFQAVPLYTPEDKVVFAYFRENLAALNAMTGKALPIIIPEAVLKGDVDDVYTAVESPRYPGLKRTNLPCLWIEGPNKKHFTLPIPRDNPDHIKDLMRRLSDLAVESHSVDEFREKVSKNPGVPQPREEGGKGLVVALFLMALVSVAVYILAVPVLHQYASGVPVIFALALIGLVPPGALYMFLDNYASFRGAPFGMGLKLGGPAAIWGTVFVLGLLYQKSLPTGETAFACSVYFHLPDTANEPALADGTLTLQLDEPKDVPIRRGYASVARVPSSEDGKEVNFQLTLPGYELVDKAMKIKLASGQRIPIQVKRSKELGVHNTNTFTCGFYIHEGEDHDAVVSVDGKLSLLLDEPKSVPIGRGFAQFTNIPEAWNGQDVNFIVDVPGFRVTKTDAKVRLERDGRVYISVKSEKKPEASPEEVPKKPGT